MVRIQVQIPEKNINKTVFKVDFSFYCVILPWQHV